MEDIIKLQKKLVPDLLEVLNARYTLLRIIKYRQPIGRRNLATVSGLSERVVRSETNFLKSQNLIDIQSSGMYTTEEGLKVYSGLKALMNDVNEAAYLENELKEALGIREAVIVSGSMNDQVSLINEVGKAAANYIRNLIGDNEIISLTGGRTIKAVVDNFQSVSGFKNIKVVPGRGGMGNETDIQSNTLVEALANKLCASYELLHIPDNISENLFRALLDETEIGTIFESISKSDILIHGIGLAKEMCLKRNLQQDISRDIMRKGAIGEAYGYFFDSEGNVIYKMPSVGFSEEDMKRIPNIVAVAYGIEKVEAIIGIERNKKNSVLVTDEATAIEILRILKS